MVLLGTSISKPAGGEAEGRECTIAVASLIQFVAFLANYSFMALVNSLGHLLLVSCVLTWRGGGWLVY